MATALIFSGQGAQKVGMGKSLYENSATARALYDEANRVLGWWSALGFSEAETVPATVVTPACGLAGASPGWARTALSLAERVARNLSEGEGRMDP